METARNVPLAANDRCTVTKATPFHRRQLEAVLDAANAEQASALTDFEAADLLVKQDVFLAYERDQPIGCIMAMSGPITVLHGLFVLPTERGRGHGSELIRSALETFERQKDRREYWTAIDPANDGALERFSKFGFRLVPELAEEGLQLMTRRGNPLTTSFDSGHALGARHAPVHTAMAG